MSNGEEFVHKLNYDGSDIDENATLEERLDGYLRFIRSITDDPEDITESEELVEQCRKDNTEPVLIEPEIYFDGEGNLITNFGLEVRPFIQGRKEEN